jgi:hypothetical protein
MDTLAALALGTEVPDDALLQRKPYGRYDRLISTFMWRNIIGQSIFQVRSGVGGGEGGRVVCSDDEYSVHWSVFPNSVTTQCEH